MDTSQDAARDARRRARSDWPVGRHLLGAEPRDDVSGLIPDERVRPVGELTLRAWRLAGKPMPSLPRSQWPGKVIRTS